MSQVFTIWRISSFHGLHQVYPYSKNNPTGRIRSVDSYANDLALCLSTKRPVNGIKGECLLSKLRFFHPTKSTSIDIMHSVYLGIVKKLFVYWFEHKSKPYSLVPFIPEINSRLSKIRPASFITQASRTIDTFNNWRDHEFMNFALYFAVTTFSLIEK